MDYQHILNYSDKNLKQLAPFKDNRIYQSMVNILRNHFFKHGYNDTPANLKEYVESQIISPYLYDIFLIGAGYPVYLVNILRLTQKKKIIENLMSYPKYSGTLKHIQNICEVLDENFNVFELYIDYRSLLDNQGKISMDWIMIPKPIYTSGTSFPLYYDYESVYNETPTYFVSKQYLETLRMTSSISLPVKSNLIVLDMVNITYDNDIQQIKSVATINYFKDHYISLFLEKNEYTITISDAYRLWYYIIYLNQRKLNSSKIEHHQSIYFNIIDNNFPFTLDPSSPNSIQKLEEEYNNLPDSKIEIESFYKKYISSQLTKPIKVNEYTLDDYRKQLVISLGLELVSEIEDTVGGLNNPHIDGIMLALGMIEDSLNYYFISSSDSLLLKFQKDLMMLFSKLLVDAEKTATYQMILEFKPFHTQLIAYSKHQINNKSKLNNVFIETDCKYVIHDYPQSATVISDDYKISRSIESTYFEFDNTNIVKTDIRGATAFTVNDLIYSRDISTNIFNTSSALKIKDIYNLYDNIYALELESPYFGVYGVFPRAYKYLLNNNFIHEEILLTKGNFYSFTNVINANEVHTTFEGFVRFSVGDYIYSPVDILDDAVEIISKDYDTLSFILKDDYNGTSGTWQSAMKWHPSS